VLWLEALIEFLPPHNHIYWSINSDPHLTALYAQHRYTNIFTDTDAFTDLA